MQKGSENQIKYDNSRFFKPLADLGIEFEQKSGGKIEEEGRYHERGEKDFYPSGKSSPDIRKPSLPMSKSFAPAKPSVFGAIKKIFTKPARPAGGENLALRELLNKTVPSKARAASAEEMNKLKNLISEKTEAKKEEVPIPKKLFLLPLAR